MPPQMFFDLGGTYGRIERNRNTTGQKYAKEAEKIVGSRRQHDCHTAARLQAIMLQSGSKLSGSFEKRAR